jgi:predicted phage terminase large subunit-like protein
MSELTLKKKFTKKEFQVRADEILGRLFREVVAFADVSEAAKKARRERACRDHFYFFETYLPHYFSAPPAPFHHELIAQVDRRPGPGEVVVPAVTAAPRGFAKSTLVSFGYTLHQICNGRRHFIILGSDTEDLASDLTGYLYLELLYNERLKCDFGELVREGWAVNDFVTLNDVRVKARGRGQRLRGMKHKQFRPDLVILDVDGSLLWIGTILARKSALYIALNGEEEPYIHWRRQLYRAIQPDGTSLWEAKFPLPVLENQKRLMGTLAFNREKMNDPLNEGGVFQEPWLRYYYPGELTGKDLVVAGFFDPSIGTSESADYKAVLTVGLDRRQLIYYVLDAYIRKGSLDEALRALFVRHEQWNYWLLGIEDNLFQRLLMREVEQMSRERGVMLPARGVTQKANKETRISRLSSWVERGQIRFCQGQGNQDLLIEQMLYFPSKTVHDDGPDALEGAISLLEGGAGQGIFDYYKGESERQRAEDLRRAGIRLVANG